jgi:hemoglobin
MFRRKVYPNLFGWLLMASVIFISCDDDDEKVDNSLYARLGKVEAISAVVDQFLANVAADNAINQRFAPTVASQSRLQALRTNLIDQICQGTGGPSLRTL